MKSFNKPPLTFTQQVQLLQSRGLQVHDVKKAERFLKQNNYYRFSAYCLPFESSRHVFKSNTSFNDIEKLYKFDRQLRMLIDEALEQVEIIIRSRIAYYLAQQYGPFVHEDISNYYFKQKDYEKWIEKIREDTHRSRELFIEHYKNMYSEFPALPIWVLMEVVSFGRLVRMINNLLKKDLVAISKDFKMHDSVFRSSLLSFSYVRNICAHHSRIIGKNLRIKFQFPKNEKWISYVDKRQIGTIIFALAYFLKASDLSKEKVCLWQDKIEEILKIKINNLDLNTVLGFKKELEIIPGWK